MSEDNAIAILATRERMWRETEHSWTRLGPVGGPGQDVFRVAHIQGPAEFSAYMDEERHNLGWWMDSAFPFDRS